MANIPPAYQFTVEDMTAYWRDREPVPPEVTARGPDAVTDWITNRGLARSRQQAERLAQQQTRPAE